MLSAWAKTLSPELREKLPAKLKNQLKALLADPDERSLKAPRSQRSNADQAYLEKLAKEDPEKLSEALLNSGLYQHSQALEEATALSTRRCVGWCEW